MTNKERNHLLEGFQLLDKITFDDRLSLKNRRFSLRVFYHRLVEQQAFEDRKGGMEIIKKMKIRIRSYIAWLNIEEREEKIC